MYYMSVIDIVGCCWQVQADDVDSGLFSQVQYAIQSVSNNGANNFDIDAETGQIYVTQPVDRGDRYILIIAAEDRASEKTRR